MAAYTSKVQLLRDLMTARGSGRLALSDAAQRAGQTTSWPDRFAYLGVGDRIQTPGSLRSGDTTRYPAITSRAALVDALYAACGCPNPGVGVLIERVGNSDSRNWE